MHGSACVCRVLHVREYCRALKFRYLLNIRSKFTIFYQIMIHGHPIFNFPIKTSTFIQF